MRLFTALWPSDEAVRHLDEAITGLPREGLAEATRDLGGFRLMPTVQWHVTLCFHGEADPAKLGTRLERRVRRLAERRELAELRLRFVGAGVFRGVLWVGVTPAGGPEADTLSTLVRAAGTDPGAHRGHVTVARWNRGNPDRALLKGLLADYAGPWWTAGEVALVRSRQEGRAHVYDTLRRVPLPGSPAGQQGAYQQP